MTNRTINYKSRDYIVGYKNGKKFYKKKYEGEISNLKTDGTRIIRELQKDLVDAENGAKKGFIIMTIALLFAILGNTIQLIY